MDQIVKSVTTGQLVFNLWFVLESLYGFVMNLNGVTAVELLLALAPFCVLGNFLEMKYFRFIENWLHFLSMSKNKHPSRNGHPFRTHRNGTECSTSLEWLQYQVIPHNEDHRKKLEEFVSLHKEYCNSVDEASKASHYTHCIDGLSVSFRHGVLQLMVHVVRSSLRDESFSTPQCISIGLSLVSLLTVFYVAVLQQCDVILPLRMRAFQRAIFFFEVFLSIPTMLTLLGGGRWIALLGRRRWITGVRGDASNASWSSLIYFLVIVMVCSPVLVAIVDAVRRSVTRSLLQNCVECLRHGIEALGMGCLSSARASLAYIRRAIDSWDDLPPGVYVRLATLGPNKAALEMCRQVIHSALWGVSAVFAFVCLVIFCLPLGILTLLLQGTSVVHRAGLHFMHPTLYHFAASGGWRKRTDYIAACALRDFRSACPEVVVTKANPKLADFTVNPADDGCAAKNVADALLIVCKLYLAVTYVRHGWLQKSYFHPDLLLSVLIVVGLTISGCRIIWLLPTYFHLRQFFLHARSLPELPLNDPAAPRCTHCQWIADFFGVSRASR